MKIHKILEDFVFNQKGFIPNTVKWNGIRKQYVAIKTKLINNGSQRKHYKFIFTEDELENWINQSPNGGKKCLK